MGTHTNKSSGFTLVEISIVMIIIGLLIGGTFGGMKLVENMQVNKTVQDLKAIESAALTFKDTYGRLPGDLRNPSTRLPNCTVAPCATGGNGDRMLDAALTVDAAIADTNERYTFWSHLLSADLVSMGIKNTTDMSYGEGSPESPVGGGYRISRFNSTMSGTVPGEHVYREAIIWMRSDPSGAIPTGDPVTPCIQAGAIDRKIDDGLHYVGKMGTNSCAVTPTADSLYRSTGNGTIVYDLAF